MGDDIPDRPVELSHVQRRRALQQSWRQNANLWIGSMTGKALQHRAVTMEVIRHAVLRALPERGQSHVLDLGCGEGWLSGTLLESGVDQVSGIDGSVRMLKAAREMHPRGDFHGLDYARWVRQPQLMAGPFDAVVANFSLLDNLVFDLFRVVYNALKPGGALIIQTLVLPADSREAPGWREETFAAFADEGETWQPMPYFLRTEATWVDLLVKRGFRIVKVEHPADPDTGRVLSLLLVAQRPA